MGKQEFIELLESIDHNYRLVKQLPDGTWVGLQQRIFTVGLFVGINESGYEYHYCYATWGEAIMAITVWDGTQDAPGLWIVRKGKAGGDFYNTNRVGYETSS